MDVTAVPRLLFVSPFFHYEFCSDTLASAPYPWAETVGVFKFTISLLYLQVANDTTFVLAKSWVL